MLLYMYNVTKKVSKWMAQRRAKFFNWCSEIQVRKWYELGGGQNNSFGTGFELETLVRTHVQSNMGTDDCIQEYLQMCVCLYNIGTDDYKQEYLQMCVYYIHVLIYVFALQKNHN